jgi:hypothetical protein
MKRLIQFIDIDKDINFFDRARIYSEARGISENCFLSHFDEIWQMLSDGFDMESAINYVYGEMA